MEEPFWGENIQILLDRTKLQEFIPKKGMTENQIYNSIVRFTMYLSVILVVLNNNLNYLGILILGLLFTYLHKYYVNDDISIKESDATLGDISREDFELELENENCRKPTKDNPFMNRLQQMIYLIQNHLARLRKILKNKLILYLIKIKKLKWNIFIIHLLINVHSILCLLLLQHTIKNLTAIGYIKVKSNVN